MKESLREEAGGSEKLRALRKRSSRSSSGGEWKTKEVDVTNGIHASKSHSDKDSTGAIFFFIF